jgi:hypothetical protein
MNYVQITMPVDAAHRSISALGDFGSLHVVSLADANNPSKQYTTYKKRVQDCNFWLKKLESFQDDMRKHGVQYLPEDYFSEPEAAEGGGFEGQGPFNVQQGNIAETADILVELKGFLGGVEDEYVRSVLIQRANAEQIFALEMQRHVLDTCEALEMKGSRANVEGKYGACGVV